MIDININLHDGSIKINDTIIDNSRILFLKTKEKYSLNFSEHKIKKSTIYRSNVADYHNKCFIEAIAIEYNFETINKITVNFIDEEKNQPYSMKKMKAFIFLEKIKKNKPQKHGLSEVEFPFTWGRINLIHDIKTASSMLVLHYKKP